MMTSINFDSVPSLNLGFKVRKIGEKCMIVNRWDAYDLSSTGYDIVSLILESKTVSEIIATVREKYDANNNEVTSDCLEFLEFLLNEKVIHI